MLGDVSNMTAKTKINIWLYIFIIGLVISGVTAFPLEWELGVLDRYLGQGTAIENTFPELSACITKVYGGLDDTNAKYPFIAYGTDWLAFAHLILAVLFIGPLRDPVKNIWVIDFGIIACVLVVPFALICGGFRDIPLFWRLLDCLFGIIGIVPLLIVKGEIKKLAS